MPTLSCLLPCDLAARFHLMVAQVAGRRTFPVGIGESKISSAYSSRQTKVRGRATPRSGDRGCLRHARRRLRDRRATKRSDWRVGRAGGPIAASRRRASDVPGGRLCARRDTERSDWRGGRAGPLVRRSGVGRERRTLFWGLAQRLRGSATALPLDERRQRRLGRAG